MTPQRGRGVILNRQNFAITIGKPTSVDALLGGNNKGEGRGRCEIDGVTVQGLPGPEPTSSALHPPYRVQSPVFDYTLLPHDNLDVLIDGNCYQNPPVPDLTVVGAVADGVYVMIKPLPVGQHTIKFGLVHCRDEIFC